MKIVNEKFPLSKGDEERSYKTDRDLQQQQQQNSKLTLYGMLFPFGNISKEGLKLYKN